MGGAGDHGSSSERGETAERASARTDTDAASARRRALVEHAREVLFSTELDGSILDANASAGAALGIDLSLGRQEALLLCVGPDDAACVRRVLENIAATSSATELELHLRSPNGLVLWAVRACFNVEAHAVLWSAATIADSEAAGLRRVVLDKQELLERERQRSAMSEAASVARDRLLAIVGQDSTVTLNTVLGWTRMLRSEVLDAASRDMALAVIQGNVERHLALLSDLLEVARILDGDLALDLRSLSLGPIVDAAVAKAKDAAAAKGVALVQTPSGDARARFDDTTVLADRRVLERLVCAAVEDFVEGSASGDRVTVDTACDDAWCTLRFSGRAALPSGPEAVLRSNQPATASVRRTGELTFILVDRVARIHGGGATQSTQENGDRVLEARVPRIAQAPIQASPAERPLRGVRVLVYDPSSDTRELAAVVLRETGAHVLSARDASTAAAAVSAFRPDVVVGDVAAADDAGERLLDHVEVESSESSPPLVALVSSEAEASILRDAEPVRKRVIVPKPIDASALVDAVRRSQARADDGTGS